MPSPSYDDRLTAMFDSFCKEVSRNYVRDLVRKNERRGKYVSYEPADYLLELLRHEDAYPSHAFMLAGDGYQCMVEDETLYQALLSLKERQRKVLALGFWYGLADGEIAERMEVSVRTVYNLRQRAFRAVRDYYGEKPTDNAIDGGADTEGRPGGAGGAGRGTAHL